MEIIKLRLCTTQGTNKYKRNESMIIAEILEKKVLVYNINEKIVGSTF